MGLGAFFLLYIDFEAFFSLVAEQFDMDVGYFEFEFEFVLGFVLGFVLKKYAISISDTRGI
jgi:hypothetical protein